MADELENLVQLAASLGSTYVQADANRLQAEINKVQGERQTEEAKADRRHQMDMLNRRIEIDRQNDNREIIWRDNNWAHHAYKMVDGKSVLDEAATLQNIQEHSKFVAKGAQQNKATQLKADEYYKMTDATPGYYTDENLAVFDSFMEDEYFNPSYQYKEGDTYLNDLGLLEANEVYTETKLVSDIVPDNIVQVDKDTLMKRYNAFKEGIVKSNIYKDSAEYGAYLSEDMKRQTAIGSAMFQTEEMKATKLAVGSIKQDVQNLLYQHGFLKEDTNDEGELVLVVDDEEYLANSEMYKMITAPEGVEAFLKEKYRQRMGDDTLSNQAWKEWYSKFEAEAHELMGYDVANKVISQLNTNIKKIVDAEATQQKMIDNMLLGEKVKSMQFINQQISASRGQKAFSASAQEYAASVKSIMESDLTIDEKKAEIEHLNSLYNK